MSLPAQKRKTAIRIVSFKIGKDTLIAQMSDGREVSIPIAWFRSLSIATKKQLENFEISPAGYGVHWPELDEDVSIKAFLE